MTTKFASIKSLRDAIVSPGANAEYKARMYQKIPELPTVKDRGAYLVEKARDKVVLDIGCTGGISKAIRAASKTYYGMDIVPGEGWDEVNLDHRPDEMPVHEDVETIICSEFLEHLSNPGWFLMALRQKYPGREVYITVPNAGAYLVREDCEVVNSEHVCYYSYQTLKVLVTRYDYEILQARWYNGEPYKAEGIIMVVK